MHIAWHVALNIKYLLSTHIKHLMQHSKYPLRKYIKHACSQSKVCNPCCAIYLLQSRSCYLGYATRLSTGAFCAQHPLAMSVYAIQATQSMLCDLGYTIHAMKDVREQASGAKRFLKTRDNAIQAIQSSSSSSSPSSFSLSSWPSSS